MSRPLHGLLLASILSLPSFAAAQEPRPAPPTPASATGPVKPETSHAVERLPETPGERPDAPHADLKQAAKIVRERTNAFRREQKLGPVEPDELLTKTAEAFAEYMATKHVYGHEADGRTPAERATAAGYEFCTVRENIAFEFKESGFTTERLGESLFTGWKNSPEHRENMLAAEVIDTGVAIAKDERSGKHFGVQLFGRPRSREFTFVVVNETEATIPYRVGVRDYELPPRLVRTHTECLAEQVAFLPLSVVKGPDTAAAALTTPAAAVEEQPSKAAAGADAKPGSKPIATFDVSGGERLVATSAANGYQVRKAAKRLAEPGADPASKAGTQDAGRTD